MSWEASEPKESSRLMREVSYEYSDTLFQGGCGRFFEGTPEEMHKALSYLGTLPDDTVVWNGHEYTASSVKFGSKIEPENQDVKR